MNSMTEVFLPARTKSDVAEHSGLNGPLAAHLRTAKFEQLSREGRVAEHAMPDTLDRLRDAGAFLHADPEFALLREAILREAKTLMIGTLAAAEAEWGWLWGLAPIPGYIWAEDAAAVGRLRAVFEQTWRNYRQSVLDGGHNRMGRMDSLLTTFFDRTLS